MRRLMLIIFATSLVLPTFAGEHDAADTAASPEPAADQAIVRVLHASPNAELARVRLVLEGNDVADHAIGAVEYMAVTDYVPVPEGSYTLTVALAGRDGGEAATVELPQTLSMARGHAYTVALIGLVMPEVTEATDDGFLVWLQDLFTAERDDLALQALLLDDVSASIVAPDEVDVRLLHAAPGTDMVDLAFVRDDDADVLGTVAFGEETGFLRIRPDEGALEVRVAGSDVVAVEVAELELDGGMLHTIVVAGTPIEDVPLQAVVLTNEWFDPLRVAPGAPGTVAPVAGVMTADQADWVREQILAAETWLDAAEERLFELTEHAEAEALAAAARQDIEQARAFLEQARFQLESSAGRTPTRPAAE